MPHPIFRLGRLVVPAWLVLGCLAILPGHAADVPKIELRDPSEVRVSWPETSVLESSAALGPAAAWEPVTEGTSVPGGLRALELRPLTGSRYFRLIRSGVPALEILKPDAETLRISWEDDGQARILETSERLLPATWVAVTPVPVLSGNRWTTTLKAPQGTRFFRLRSQDATVSIALQLSVDTGIRATDSITSLAAASGTVSPRTAWTILRAGMDGMPSAQYQDITSSVDTAGRLELGTEALNSLSGGLLADGPHTLKVLALDAAASVVGTGVLSFTLDTTPPQVALSPSEGQSDVLPGQLPVAVFSEPVYGAGTTEVPEFPAGTFTARSVESVLPGRVVTDRTGSRVTLVPVAEFPGNSRIEIQFAATNLMDLAGNVVPVLTAQTAFRTANSVGLPGTSLTGWVFNSVRNEQGGENPIPGAVVSVLNGGSLRAVTDSNGRFVLTNVPAGRLLIEVDGHPVKTPPGYFFPTVAKLFESIPGLETLIGEPIYLPLVQDAAFVALSTTTTTSVANNAQLPGWHLEVPPNTVERRDGTVAGRLSITPVPANRLPAPLPPGVDPGIVITIQAEGGADVFRQPVPLTAPNLEGLPPGSKTVLWDFDHARGEFVPVATLTVSADGQTVTTDPGQGVIRPGWHFVLDLVQGTAAGAGGHAYLKPNLDWNKVGECTVRLTLSTTTLVTDVTQFAPGPLGVASGILGDVADGARKSIDSKEPKAETVKAAVDSAVADGLGQTGEELSEAAQQIENAATPVRNGKAAEGLARFNEKVAQAAGKAGSVLKSVSGVYSIYKLAKEGPEQVKRWQEDVDCLRNVLKDPPGDAIDRTLRAMDAARDAVEAIEYTAFYGAAADLLEADAALIRIYAAVVDPPGSRILPESEKARLLELAVGAQARYARAAAVFERVQAETDTARIALKALQDEVSNNQSGRLYGRFEKAGAEASTFSGFGRLQLAEPSGTSGLLTMVDPVANLIGSAVLTFPSSGPAFVPEVEFPPIVLTPSQAPDADRNGLPDDLDEVLGHPTRAQVSALRAGLPPDEAGLATLGIIGRLPQSQTDPGGGVSSRNPYQDLIAGDGLLFGLGGTNLLEVIDLSRPSAPVKVGALRSAGLLNAFRGYARGSRVAATGFGVGILDVSDPRNPRVERLIDYTEAGRDRVNPVLGANHVVVAKGRTLLSFDINSGRQVSSVALENQGDPIKMELNGDVITLLAAEVSPVLQFTVTTVRLDAQGQLSFLGDVRPFFWSTGSLTGPYGMAIDDRAAFVGPWLISADPFVPGFGTISLSDPTQPTVIAPPNLATATGAAQLAADNAGHLLATVAATAQNRVLDVYDVRDLNRTDRRLLSLPLDLPPYAPRFMAGLAVFATEADTYVARIAPLDGAGIPPVIGDVVLQTGTVATEGRHVGVHVAVTDDAQVARVELLLQGDNPVAGDSTYPFDLDFQPPDSLPEGQPLTLTVRATDTGGNRSEKTFPLTYHARVPQVASVIPPPGFTTRLPLSRAILRFDKAVARGIVPADLDLRAAGSDGNFDTADDIRVSVASLRFTADNFGLTLDFGGPLPVGHYRLTVPASRIADRGGNALAGDFVTTFDVLHVPEFAFDAFPFRGIPTDLRQYTNFNVQSGSSPLVVADVNGDGRADLVRAVFSGSQDTGDYRVITVTLQEVGGGFGVPVAFPAPNRVVQLLSGDVDGDAKVDLVAVSLDTAAIGFPPQPQPLEIAVLAGNGDGTFQPPAAVDTGGLRVIDAGRFVLGHFTGTTRMDLAQLIRDRVDRDSSTGEVTNSTPARVIVYPSRTGAPLGAPVVTELPVPQKPAFPIFYYFAADDLNRDGKTDLLLPGFIGLVPTQVLTSRGDGTFTMQSNTVIHDISDPVMADFNGDDQPDLVAGTQFFRGLAGGGFERVANSGLAAGGVQQFGQESLAAEFTGDGRMDLLAPVQSTGFSSSTYGIFSIQADGSFARVNQATLPLRGSPIAVSAADVNDDRQLDLVMSGGEGIEAPFFAMALIRSPDGGFPAYASTESLFGIGSEQDLDGLPRYADLTGDGIPDLIGSFSDPRSERAVIVVPTVETGFGTMRTNRLGVTDPNYFIRAVGTGDFDDDGKTDVAVSEFHFTFSSADEASVYWMHGNGDGTLGEGVLVPGAKNLVATGDFNSDGMADLLTFRGETGFGAVLALLPGRGDGTFGDPIISQDPSFSFNGPLLVGDFNGDGKPDLLARGGRGNPSLGVWLNDGHGHYSLASVTGGAPGTWEIQGLGDFNRDGRLDVLLNDRSGSVGSYKAYVLAGDGKGNLGAPLAPTPFPGNYNGFVQVADINGDGDPDLVAAGGSPNQLQEARISLGNGDGTFQPPISFYGPDGGVGVRTLDFNRDGRLDLMVGGAVYLQSRASAP